MIVGSEILWLSEADVSALLTMDEALSAMEEAFRLQGQKKAQLPAKIYLDFTPHPGDLRAMPAYLPPPFNAAGVKIVNSNPANPAKGLPAVAGIMVYVDPETGLPLGVFGAGTLTAIRTGAAGGVAARALAKKESATVGLIGCGRQAHTQLQALLAGFDIKRVFVVGKDKEEADAFCASHLNEAVAYVPCASAREACDADIVVTTTPARTPVIQSSWVKPGTHINAIGADAPGKQELDGDLLKRARVVVDEWHQASHAGEINVAVANGLLTREQLAGELGQILVGEKPGRQSNDDITIFDSTGLAIQDVAVAKRLYEKAVKLNKGQVLKLYG